MVVATSVIVKNMITTQTKKSCITMVRIHPYTLKYAKYQSEEMCLEAIKKNWELLQYVHNQTEEMCLVAVKKSDFALKYVKFPTENIYFEAMKRHENWAKIYLKSDNSKHYVNFYSELKKDLMEKALNKLINYYIKKKLKIQNPDFIFNLLNNEGKMIFIFNINILT